MNHNIKVKNIYLRSIDNGADWYRYQIPEYMFNCSIILDINCRFYLLKYAIYYTSTGKYGGL